MEGHANTVSATKPKSRLRTCWVCDVETRGKIRRHVFGMLPQHVGSAVNTWFKNHQWPLDTHLQQNSDGAMFDGHSQDHQIRYTFDDENIHQWYLLGNGSLHGFVNRLDCGSLDDLLRYVTNRELHLSVTSWFSRQEEQILMFYVENYSPHMVTHLTLQPQTMSFVW